MVIKWIYGAVIGCLILISGLLYINTTDASEVSIVIQDSEPARTMETEVPMIVVYITGEVQNPDIYEVPEHSRLYEVIEVAGGFLPGASKESLNLARFVFDGEQIFVPQYTTDDENDSKAFMISTKVSINQGSVDELMTLTGIGETKAKAIIEYRKTYGPFQKIEDIMNVNGIKDAMYKKIKNEIVI